MGLALDVARRILGMGVKHSSRRLVDPDLPAREVRLERTSLATLDQDAADRAVVARSPLDKPLTTD